MELGSPRAVTNCARWVAVLVGCALAFNIIACRNEQSASADRQIVKGPGPRKGKGKGTQHDPERLHKVYKPTIPAAQRKFFVSARDQEDGSGTEANPWRDLNGALAKLEPGDQLVVLPGTYRGPIVVDRPCKDGTATAPIQVIGLEDTVLIPAEGEPALVIKRPYWILQRFEIVAGNSRNPAVVVAGADAHDILLEEFHLHNGWGDGIKVEQDVRRLTIANSHIHNFGHPKHNRKAGGISLANGVAEITIVGNKIHHGFAGPIYVGDQRYGDTRPDGAINAPPGVTLSENRVEMSWDGD